MKKELLVSTLAYLSSCSLLHASPIGLTTSKLDIATDLNMQRQKEAYLSALTNSTQSGEGLPNILIILADDLSRQDLSCYKESHKKISTPNIDKLASGGVLFENCYASAPICAPSRAGLITGRDQNRFGFCSQPMQKYAKSNLEYAIYKQVVARDNMRPVPNKFVPTKKQIKLQGLPSSEITIADMLSARSYNSALIGKWHLGYESEKNPLEFGFATHYGFTEAFSLYAKKSNSSIIYKPINLFSERHIYRQGRRGTSAILHNKKVVSEDEHLTDAFTNQTISFIKNSTKQNPNRPFFVLSSFNAPHTPYQPLKKYYNQLDHIEDENFRAYLALVKHLDDSVGKIYSYLEEASLLDNTLIIFTSDNGAATYTKASFSDPLKGGKFSLWEGGTRVPALFYWKNKFDDGKRVCDPITLLDIFSTVADITNTPLESSREYDGISLAPILMGRSSTLPKRSLYWQMVYVGAILDGNYKLIHNSRDKSYLLYDLKNDPYEKNDLSLKLPEQVKELETKLRLWQSTLHKPLWPHVMEYNYIDSDKTTSKDNWYPL